MKRPGWSQSTQFRAIAVEAIRVWNSKRHLQLRCGAHAKITGEPCRQIAMPNGRCYFHGGATPRGDRWHKLQPPKAGPAHARKFQGKMIVVERRAGKRSRQLDKMTPEERAAHKEWQRAHEPGPPAKRAAERARRKQNREAREHYQRTLNEPRPVSPEVAKLRAEIEELQQSGAARPVIRPGIFNETESETKAMGKHETAAEAMSRLLTKIQTESAEVAVTALEEVAANKDAPAPARATAGSALLRAAGFFERREAAGEVKPIHEMSLAEVQARLVELQKIREMPDQDRDESDVLG